jgi:hypothetical protein
MRFVIAVFILIFMVPRLGPAALPQSSHPRMSDSGNSFLEICKHVDDDYDAKYATDVFTCLAWMNGFVEGILVSDEFRNASSEQRMFCPDQNVTTLQLIHVAQKYIDNNPARAHLLTRYLVSEAFIAAFPCKK